MTNIQVRKLNSGDFHKLLKIAGKMGNNALVSLVKQTQVTNFSAGMAFVSAALECASEDIKALLCDLTGLTIEQYDQQEFDFPIDVMEKVFEQQDMGKVFLRVKGLMSKIIIK